MINSTHGAANIHGVLSESAIRETVAALLDEIARDARKILLIVPDGTRTAPVGKMFRTIHELLKNRAKLDVMIALGTHEPMSDREIDARLEISPRERDTIFRDTQFFNHAWDDKSQLQSVGVIPQSEIETLSRGAFCQDVEVHINKRVFDYDCLLILGPVFPHEVAGFSGGNKYLFPGIGGPEILNFFHWLGAVVTNPKIIGHKHTPVRAVIDRAAQMVPVKKACLAMTVRTDGNLAALYGGTPEAAWEKAADVSAQIHVIEKDAPFQTVLACAPPMYRDLWTGGKCMYKLESVVADGGELIIYAPHIREVSSVHGAWLEKIGYHTRDYFLANWEKFKDVPWGVLAHSTHVRGVGEMQNGSEKPRIRVTLATQISEEVCRQINMGYRDPQTINIEDFANRENENILLVRKAGEVLYRLKDAPHWAQG